MLFFLLIQDLVIILASAGFVFKLSAQAAQRVTSKHYNALVKYGKFASRAKFAREDSIIPVKYFPYMSSITEPPERRQRRSIWHSGILTASFIIKNPNLVISECNNLWE